MIGILIDKYIIYEMYNNNCKVYRLTIFKILYFYP